MNVFKNPVGRPPKDLKKKRAITIIVIALVLLLGGSIATISILGINMSDLMGSSIKFSDTPNGKTYIGTMDANGGTINGKTSVTWRGKHGHIYNVTGYKPVKTGYTFKGWYSQKTGGVHYAGNFRWRAQSNVWFFAQWTPSKYTVTFDAQGGTTPTKRNIMVTYNSRYGTLADTNRAASKKGYRFAGWYTGRNGTGTKITANSIVKITRNITLYAYWKPIKIIMVGPSNITRYESQNVDYTAPNGTYRIIDGYKRTNGNLAFVVGSGLGLDWELSTNSSKTYKKTNGQYISGGTHQVYSIINNDKGKYDYNILYYLSGNTVENYGGTATAVKNSANSDFKKYSDLAKTLKAKYPNTNINVFIVGLNPINCKGGNNKLLCAGDRGNKYAVGKRSNQKYLTYMDKFKKNKSNYIKGYIDTYNYSVSFIGKNNIETKNNTAYYQDGVHYKLSGTSRIYEYVMKQLDTVYHVY